MAQPLISTVAPESLGSRAAVLPAAGSPDIDISQRLFGTRSLGAGGGTGSSQGAGEVSCDASTTHGFYHELLAVYHEITSGLNHGVKYIAGVRE